MRIMAVSSAFQSAGSGRRTRTWGGMSIIPARPYPLYSMSASTYMTASFESWAMRERHTHLGKGCLHSMRWGPGPTRLVFTGRYMADDK